MAVSFAKCNLFMSAVERAEKPLVWKRYIDDVFSLWDTSIEDINGFRLTDIIQPLNSRLKYVCIYLFTQVYIYMAA